MNLPRAAFDNHFSPVFQVHCLREWTKIANGQTHIFPEDFHSIVWPVIERLHREGKGERPSPDELTGAVYDALSAAGVEIAIGPNRHGHG